MKRIFCQCGCGQEFDKYDKRGRPRRFIKGHNKPWLGKSRSKETKKKISKGHKGKRLSKETKNKISKYYKEREKWVGEKHPLWKGGITPENRRIRHSIEHRLWRESVFARDSWTCQKTGVKGGKLHPHHILNFAQYPKLRFAIDNGITLSTKAHKEFHKKYGNRNNTREQLEEFLRDYG